MSVPNETTSGESELVKALLGQRVKCTLDDGRVATGTLVCLDRLKNLILTAVVEERQVDSSAYSTRKSEMILARRQLSQAMIPGLRLVKVEIEKAIYDKSIGR